TLHPVASDPAKESLPSLPLETAGPDTNPDAVIRSGGADEVFSGPLPEMRGDYEPSPPPAPRESSKEEDDELLLPPSPLYGAISIVSAVLGVVTCVGGILFAPLAIIFGHTALAK